MGYNYSQKMPQVDFTGDKIRKFIGSHSNEIKAIAESLSQKQGQLKSERELLCYIESYIEDSDFYKAACSILQLPCYKSTVGAVARLTHAGNPQLELAKLQILSNTLTTLRVTFKNQAISETLETTLSALEKARKTNPFFSPKLPKHITYNWQPQKFHHLGSILEDKLTEFKQAFDSSKPLTLGAKQ